MIYLILNALSKSSCDFEELRLGCGVHTVAGVRDLKRKIRAAIAAKKVIKISRFYQATDKGKTSFSREKKRREHIINSAREFAAII